MELRQQFLTLRRWLWLIALCILLSSASALIVSLQVTPVYQASATLLIQQAPLGNSNEYQNILTSERLARTYSEMISSRPVVEDVVAELGLSESPDELTKRLNVELVRDTQLIRLKVEDTDPHRAARIADGVAAAFVARIESMQQVQYAESMASIQAQMENLSRVLEETEGRIRSLESAENTDTAEQAELARLENILAGYRTTYSGLVQNYEQMRVTAARSADNVILFEKAKAPDTPVRPRAVVNTAVAALVGAMVGVGSAFLIEYLDDTVRTPDDVQSATGLSVLGAIGRLGEGDEEFIVAAAPLSPISEAFRKLRTNVEFLNVDCPLRTLLITSPGPTEGKTLVALNLAAAMAQAGKEAVFVEADLRRPRVAPILKPSSKVGLTHALVEGRLDGKVQTSELEGFRFLAAGEKPPNPAELLSSNRMSVLLEKLADDADAVIIDSPPVLPVADAVLLAQKVDAVLLLIDATETTRNAAEQAAESLRQAGANLVGAILNNLPSHSGYGYYYGGYVYGEYQDDGHSPRKRGPLAAANHALTGKKKRVARSGPGEGQLAKGNE
jgi:non-specific protein-tyrosine kinase